MGQVQPARRPIDPATGIGAVALAVADLGRSLRFYTDLLGFAPLRRSGRGAVLGIDGVPRLLLTEQPGALPWMVDAMTGLYHFAVLLPERAALGSFLRHLFARDYPPPGQGDHVVSEALYLRDPDGHGVEVYADRPRADWRWVDGRVQMGAGPVDVRGLLAEAARAGLTWSGLPTGTTIGHVHLQVADVEAAEHFYCQRLGLDLVASVPGARFVAAGGYHHHVGLNSWHSQGAGPAPADVAALGFCALALPSRAALEQTAAGLAAAGSAPRPVGDALAVDDPSGNRLLLLVGPPRDAEQAEALLAAAGSA